MTSTIILAPGVVLMPKPARKNERNTGQKNRPYVLFGTQCFKYGNDEVIMKSKIINNVKLTAYPGYILIHSSSSHKYQPELTLNMTNTGTQNAYFGGFRAQGLGNDTSTLNISNLINLGYSTTKAIGSIVTSGLTFGTFLTLYNNSVTLYKSGNTDKSYYTETHPLSNPATNIFSHSSRLKAPYVLSRPDHYFEIRTGIIGYPTASTKYNINIAYNV